MRELIDNALWVGNALDIRADHGKLFACGVGAVVDLAFEEPPAVLPRSLVYCRLPLQDDGENPLQSIRLAVSTTTSFLREQIPTLVCCSAGMSRSPIIASLAASGTLQLPPTEALLKLFPEKPHDISPALWNSAIKACENILPNT